MQLIVDKKTLCLRRIGYRDAETGKLYEFLANHFKLSAKTIANVYKERWQIEIFFREIKQNLRINKFIGNSVSAVTIQIYTALTIYLLLAYQKFLSKLNTKGIRKVPRKLIRTHVYTNKRHKLIN